MTVKFKSKFKPARKEQIPAKRNENNMAGPAYFEIMFPIRI